MARPFPSKDFFLCAQLLCLAGAHAADPPRHLTAECQMIVLPMKLALPLIPELCDEAKIAAAWPRVQAMIASGEATLLATLMTEGTESKPLLAESVEEFRYATEFDPPAVPESFFDPPLPGVREPKSIEMLKLWPVVGIRPTAFETRTLGPRMELEIGQTANPGFLACAYHISHTRLEHMDKVDAGRLANGERLSFELPRISFMHDSSSTTMVSGKPKLLGVHRLPGTEGKLELFLLKITVQPAKTP